jgi:hypothetical protein
MTKSKETNFVPGDTAPVTGTPEATVLSPKVPETIKKMTDKKKKLAIGDMFDNVGKIRIKPYLDDKQENMGLEKYNMVLFPGVYHEEQLAAIERNGVVRYVTGLDEFASEVQNITDIDTREAVIKNIRLVVAELEKRLATNVLKIDDEHFWDKVKLLRPENSSFWEKVAIRVSNEPVNLTPLKDPHDLIKFMAIEAGGFDLVAKSYEDAQAQSRPPKFYLDKETHTVSTKTVYKKLRNRAIGLLDEVYNGNPKKLLYITKIIDSNSSSYKITTPIDVLYEACDEYIAGNGGEKKTMAAERFIETSNMDMETLKLKALVKDATFFRMIVLKPDGMLYHSKTSVMMGRNIADVVIYLKNPLNEDVLRGLLEEVESLWNN